MPPASKKDTHFHIERATKMEVLPLYLHQNLRSARRGQGVPESEMKTAGGPQLGSRSLAAMHAGELRLKRKMQTEKREVGRGGRLGWKSPGESQTIALPSGPRPLLLLFSVWHPAPDC